MKSNCASSRQSYASFRTGSNKKGCASLAFFEGCDAAGKGGTIRALQSAPVHAFFAWLPSRLPPTAKKRAVFAALRGTLPGGRQDRDFRPQPVQPGWRGTRDG